MNMKMRFKELLFGFLSSLLYFLVFGAVSAVYSNSLFTRMTSVRNFDWFLLILSSLLVGVFVYQYLLLKKSNGYCKNYAIGGGILGFLAFACPVCNKLIILLLGFSGAMTYFAPIQPIIGIVGVILLIYGNYILFKEKKRIKRK